MSESAPADKEGLVTAEDVTKPLVRATYNPAGTCLCVALHCE
jgi:hypothetical protein